MYKRIQDNIINSWEAKITKIGGYCSILVTLVVFGKIGWLVASKLLFFCKLNGMKMLTIENMKKNGNDLAFMKLEKKINEIIAEVEKIQKHLLHDQKTIQKSTYGDLSLEL